MFFCRIVFAELEHGRILVIQTGIVSELLARYRVITHAMLLVQLFCKLHWYQCEFQNYVSC